MKNLIKKNQAVSFVLLTYLISWIIWMPIKNLIQSELYSSPLYVVVMLMIGGYGPTISAIVISGIIGGRVQVKNLLKKFLIFRVGSKWYVIALLAGPMIAIVGTCIYKFSGGELGWINYQAFLWFPVFIFIAALFGPLAEELGWRGFLLPKVFEKYGYFKSSIILGLIHTFWHTPLFWAAEGTSISGMPITFLTVSKYAIFITGTSFIYTWVVKNTRWSVFLAILIHAGINGGNIALQYVMPEMKDKNAIWNMEFWVFAILIFTIMTFTIAKRFSKKNSWKINQRQT